MTNYSAQSNLANLFGLYNRLNEDTTYFIRELIEDKEITFDKPIYDGSTKITGINTEYVICEVKGLNATYPIEELDFLVAVKIIEAITNKLHN